MSFRNPFFPATVTITPSGGTMPISAAAALAVKTAAGDTVTQTGAATTLSPPAGTPAAATRPVAASSSAQGTVAGVASTTIIAAPGAAAQVELHNAVVQLSQSVNSRVQLQRLDNSAVLWDSTVCVGSNGVAGFSYTFPVDFKGATLPANVGVKLVGVSGAGLAASAVITYNVLS